MAMLNKQMVFFCEQCYCFCSETPKKKALMNSTTSSCPVCNKFQTLDALGFGKCSGLCTTNMGIASMGILHGASLKWGGGCHAPGIRSPNGKTHHRPVEDQVWSKKNRRLNVLPPGETRSLLARWSPLPSPVASKIQGSKQLILGLVMPQNFRTLSGI